MNERMERVSPPRLGVLISGGGRTLMNLHDRTLDLSLDADIVAVISSKRSATGIELAKERGLATHVVSRADTPDPVFHDRITKILTDAEVDLVCMAGFTTLWVIPESFAGRVINIHPALLPHFGGQGFYGMNVHRAVLAAGRTESGCTVHYCDNEYDHGQIILQRTVSVESDDTPETLAARVFEQECIAYPEAIRQVIAGL